MYYAPSNSLNLAVCKHLSNEDYNFYQRSLEAHQSDLKQMFLHLSGFDEFAVILLIKT